MTKAIRTAEGAYTLHGYTITRKTNRRWHLSNPDLDFEGSVTSLQAAITYINNHTTKPLLTPPNQPLPNPIKHKGKLTPETVRFICSETAQFFGDARVQGKVASYQRLASLLNLGLETVARVARRDIYQDVEG